MSLPTNEAGLRAVFDQGRAAIADLDRIWPFNGHVSGSAESLDRLLLLADSGWGNGGWELEAGHGYLKWPTCPTATPLPVLDSADELEALIRRSIPPYRFLNCDLCRRERESYAWLPVPMPPHVLCLMFCVACVAEAELYFTNLKWIFREA